MVTLSLNNIDLDQIEAYEAEIRGNPKEAEFTTRMEGIWCFEEGGPQFVANTKIKDGVVTFSLSHPNFAGPGPCPSPMSYGLFWMAGCATSTFMSAAEKRKIRIKSMKTTIEADLNYTRQFNLGDQPLISAYRIVFSITSDASDDEIEELRVAALNGCMAMFTIQNAIPLNMTAKKES